MDNFGSYQISPQVTRYLKRKGVIHRIPLEVGFIQKHFVTRSFACELIPVTEVTDYLTIKIRKRRNR